MYIQSVAKRLEPKTLPKWNVFAGASRDAGRQRIEHWSTQGGWIRARMSYQMWLFGMREPRPVAAWLRGSECLHPAAGTYVWHSLTLTSVWGQNHRLMRNLLRNVYTYVIYAFASERERERERRMIYSFRPLSLMKGCRRITYHLTVHTIIMPMSKKINKVTTMYLIWLGTNNERERERERSWTKNCFFLS